MISPITLLLITLLLISLFLLIFIFASPKFSPIPYFPTNKKDLPLILKALNLQDNQTVVDLGAGDGLVIFQAALYALRNNLNTRFIALDINPILILIMKLKWFFHPNKNNISIIWGDMFKLNYNSLIREPVNSFIFYLYISPWFLDKVVSKIKQIKSKKSIVSYYYPITQLKSSKKALQGVHSVYSYNV